MLDVNSIAKIICRTNLEKTFVGFVADGKFSVSAESAVKMAIEAEITKKWQKYLPEAIMVVKEVERQMEGRGV